MNSLSQSKKTNKKTTYTVAKKRVIIVGACHKKRKYCRVLDFFLGNGFVLGFFFLKVSRQLYLIYFNSHYYFLNLRKLLAYSFIRQLQGDHRSFRNKFFFNSFRKI